MVKNTDLFYVKAKEFQDKRAELMELYETKLRALERFKGSRGYEEDLKKLKSEQEEKLKDLRDEYRYRLGIVISGMMDAVGKRSVKAPTADQVNLLSVLRLRKKVTVEDLRRTAEAVKENPMCIAVLNEIAKDHELHETFDHLCDEMSSEKASGIITTMRSQVEDFIQHDTTRASRLADQAHEAIYGAAPEKHLIKRRLFEDKNGCFRELAKLDPDELRLFSDIVDAVSGYDMTDPEGSPEA